MGTHDANQGPVIGVCGHKDIVTPKEEVLRALAAFWDKLAAARPPHGDPPLLLDSLAEGGDQIVLESRPHDVSYVAVLPFASAEYEKDFVAPEAKRIYRDFLDAAASVVVAGDRPGDYTAASGYLLKHSDMILALWDCVVTDGAPAPGGSYHTITLALAAGIRVIVIPTRRKKTYSGGQKCIFPAGCRPFELGGDLSFTEF